MSYKENPYKYSLQYAYNASADEFQRVIMDAAGSLVNMNTLHHKTHRGLFFYYNTYDLALAASGNLDMLLITGDKQAHIRVKSVLLEGDGLFTLYQGTTVSNNGTALTATNANLNSSNTPEVLAYAGPTVTGVGTLLGGDFVKVGNNSVLGNFDIDSDLLILRPNTNYLLRLTNRGSGATEALITLGFYEV